MAGGKKKKKPTVNSARGFTTTSIASKPRVEVAEPEIAANQVVNKVSASHDVVRAIPDQSSSHKDTSARGEEKQLSAEEFEKRLEESDLQLLVEKFAQKVKRDAQRQKSRLETDRRLFRGQAESVNSRKWLPPELVDHILNLIQAESRFAASSIGSENSSGGKLLPEEDLTVKLWTLQLTLIAVGFHQDKVQSVVNYVLDIATHVGAAGKDSIWGLDEALDWLARECPLEDLPDYEKQSKIGIRSQTDIPADTDTPLPSGATTPLLLDPESHLRAGGTSKSAPRPKSPRFTSAKKSAVTYDEDIEPEDLLPLYLESKTRLFEILRPLQDVSKGASLKAPPDASQASTNDLKMAELLAKVDRVERDPLFDKDLAEQQWKSMKIQLEKNFAAAKKTKMEEAKEGAVATKPDQRNDGSQQVDVREDAERIAAEVLAENGGDDDDGLADLFASLPMEEADPDTGKIITVMNGADGSRVLIRDVGKWTGVSPMRVLEEACRARDSSVKISYRLVSEASFANRHMVNILWAKAQEGVPAQQIPNIEAILYPSQFAFKMTTVASPDAKQSEAFIATVALFAVFGSSPKEEKVSLRLPAVWRDLWSEIAEIKKSHEDAQDRLAVKLLRDLVRQRQDQELEDGVLLQGAFRGRIAGRNVGEAAEEAGYEKGKAASGVPEYLQRVWLEKSSTVRFHMMLNFRMQLPMWQFRQQVLEAVDREPVVIICGETGCGKSTQVPSFLLEHQLSQGKHCKIYCTEPRRISAISLARRVSEELGEARNDLGTARSLVGYSIRLEAKTTRETRLIYATTGIVMRMLEGSNDLRDITHLVLDEVHERSIDSDFLLIVLKKLMTRRKDLKVVLMSATVDADRFSKYLGGAPVLNVPGRTYPVQVQYLEDAVELTGYSTDSTNQQKLVDLDDDEGIETEADASTKPELIKSLRGYSPRTRNTLAVLDEYQIQFDLVVQLISRIAHDPEYSRYSNAILVFLPGIAEIRTLNDLLLGDMAFGGPHSNWLIYPLHSTIATEEQEQAFVVLPPGCRKIVLATNIAETGITIPDVTCVIDTGKHREMRFDERRQLSRLIDTFISRANAKQRRGRAGRVQEGLCFHLFSKYRHDALMSDQQTPEMLRLSLQDLAIRVKMCGIGAIEETLSSALDPPSAKNIRRAVDALVDVRALTAAEELTPLGKQLARLPLDVFLGKLVLLGTVFKCLDMALTVAAILSSKSPFVAQFGHRAQADAVRQGFRRGDSDLLTVYNAYLAWKRVCQSSASASSGQEFQFCRKNCLSPQVLANIEDLKGQLLTALVDSGFLSLTDKERQTLNQLRYGPARSRRRQQVFFELPQRVDLHSEVDVVAQSVIAWSFYPKLLVRDVPGGRGLRNIGNNQSISLHPASVNKGHNELRWLSYYNIMQSKSFLNAHETTAVEAFPIALLCGDVRCDMYSGVLVLDGNRGRFLVADWKTMLVVKVLRARLREMLTRAFKMPGKLPTQQHERWLDAWQRIFTQGFSKDGSVLGGVVVKGL